MPWKGYNYEDAIVINEKVVEYDMFTSVHVDEYQLEVRETKRGVEEPTADIPNVGRTRPAILTRMELSASVLPLIQAIS